MTPDRTMMDRRTLLTAAGAATLTGLAACDENTMKSVQARLNPTHAAGGAGAAAPGALPEGPGAGGAAPKCLRMAHVVSNIRRGSHVGAERSFAEIIRIVYLIC